MKKSHQILLNITRFLLICLWTYTALSKLFDYNDFRLQMSRQVLPHFLKTILLYFLPAIELSVASLLFFRCTEHIGYWASLLLMVLFTGYVGLALAGVLGQMPCSCGGVIRTMGWKLHFFFNLSFLIITCWSLFIIYKAGGLKA